MKPPHGKRFHPVAHAGIWINLGLTLFFLLLGSGLASRLPGRPVNGGTFWLGLGAAVSYVLGVYFLYRTIALFRLRYFISRNGLEIYWGAVIQRIPLQNITDIIPADSASLPNRRLLGLSLPDWWVGRWNNTLFFTTAPLSQALVIQTPAENFVISPSDLQAFLEAWRLRVPFEPTLTWEQEGVRRSIWAHPLWFDPLARRLGAGAILLSLILVGATMIAYPTWPAAIPIRFNTLGQAAAIANRQQLLWIPASGAIILALNLILGLLWYKKERLATYLLWFVTMLVQIGLWVGIRLVVG